MNSIDAVLFPAVLKFQNAHAVLFPAVLNLFFKSEVNLQRKIPLTLLYNCNIIQDAALLSNSIQKKKLNLLKEDFGWIIGEVRDIIDSSAVKKARIEILKQIVDRLPDGSYRIRSIDEAIPLGIVIYTDQRGMFKAKIPLSEEPNYFVIVVKAKGYHTVNRVLVPARKNEVTKITIELVKTHPTPLEKEIIERKLEERKKRISQ
jgi:hypothetical protein